MSDEFIILIRNKNRFWYFTSTEPDVWVIDNTAYGQTFIDAGYELPPVSEDYPRYRYGVLTSDNVEGFLQKVSDDEQSVSELHKLLSSCLPTDCWWDICDYAPQLYYDFDNKQVYSAHEQHIFETQFLDIL